VIAHRLETIRLANRVLLLDRGRLVADASHETLLRENALYQALLTEMGHPRSGGKRRPKKVSR